MQDSTCRKPIRIRSGRLMAIVLALGMTALNPGAQQRPPARPPVPVVPQPVDRTRGLERYIRLIRTGGDQREAAWQVWWELNKEWYLGLARRDQLPGREASGEGGPFLGKRTRPDPSARPFGADLRVRLIRPDLQLLLEDDKVVVRSAAAQALGLLGDAGAAESLVAAVRDSNTDVQDTAALALGMLGNKNVVAVLREVIFPDARNPEAGVRPERRTDRLRATAALALGLAGDPEARSVLIAATARREARDLRAAAVLGLGLLGDRASEAFLVKLYNAPKTGIQMQAVIAGALGHHSGAAACEQLLKAIKSKKSEIRRSAALALGHIVLRTTNLDRLEDALENRQKAREMAPEARKKLEAYIKELEEPARAERELVERFDLARRRALSHAAFEDPEYVVRQFACVALGQVGLPEDRARLVRLLDHEILELRPFAALGLGILGGRGHDEDGAVARILLTAFEKERRLDHKVAFAVALGLRGWGEAAPAVLKALKATSEPLSRSYYAMALAMLAYREALPEVVNVMLQVREKDELQQTAMAYGLLATGRSADELVKVLQTSKSQYDRAQAAVGLALFGRSADLRMLSGYLRSTENPSVERAFVAEGIGMAGDARDPGPLARIAVAYNFHLGFEAIDRTIQRKW